MKFLSFVLLPVLAAQLCAAQTNDLKTTNSIAVKAETNRPTPTAQQIEKIRTECLQGRRLTCGKILKILPEGLVVESGYTDLLRPPLDKSWLVPGSATASRTANLVEGNEPGSVCLGTIFLTDYPKSKKLKPKQYDYVIIEGYPAGQFTYTSLEPIHKTVRRFSAQLSKAVESHFQAEQKLSPPAAGVK